MKEPKLFEISIEEFDKPKENHIFSKRYEKQKEEALNQYRKKMQSRGKVRFAKIAAAVAVVMIVGPLTVNAATNGEMFSRIWGILGKSNIKPHDEVIYEKEKGTSVVVNYPQREYEDIDPETAKKLIGDSVEYPSITREVDGTTISILSVVRDQNSAVIEFSLEKAGGVDALEYSQTSNEGKGATFSENAKFEFFIGNGGFIYVDSDKSTEDKLYCYDYVALGENADELNLEIDEYPCTRGERQTIVDSLDEQALDKLAKDTKTTTVKIPMSKQLKAVPYVNAKNGSLEISPISMKVDMTTGLGLSKDEAIEPYNCYYLSINYKDGTNYVVTEHEKEGEHTCDVDTDNAYYTLGDDAGQLSFVFNRLVDTDKIKSITVNNTDYTLK